MDCQHVIFSGHAVRRMFQRRISRDSVLQVIQNGEVIADYADDEPFPSQLLLEWVNGRAIHVVLAYDVSTGTCYVITAYDPDPTLWDDSFRSRRIP
ncbi:MAG: DUF4258 domain-containing protein [Planctomycetes bacterium]|nr:DUF4258 domain-containing protein [Planctomycetota bacterium]